MDNLATEESRSSQKSPLVWFVGAAAGLVVMVGLGWALVARQSEPELGEALLLIGPTVPEFTLTESSGKPVTRSDLLGKVWVADFVFTRCSGPCPTLSARMQAIQLALVDEPSVKLVTFTLDPENDTPSVLVDYAKRFHADPDRWWFITGDKQEVMQKFVVGGLKQTFFPGEAGEEIIHSVYLVVIDRQGRIRSAHDGIDPKSKALVVRDVRQLLAEPDSPS